MSSLFGNVIPRVLLFFRPVAAAGLILTAATSSAAPTLTVECSSAQIRKSESFKMYLRITAEENMSNIDVKWIPPTGFTLKLDKENENYPKEMKIGSSYTFAFSGTPPPALNIGHSPGADTRERKVFIFNVGYATQVGGISEAHQQTIKLDTGFSVDDYSYLAWGVFGLVLGGAIKRLTRYGPERPQGGSAERPNAAPVVRSLGSSLIDLLSVAAIGFVVLLVLARESIPTKGWYDSLALGVAVAILSDDQLLTRVKSLVPKMP